MDSGLGAGPASLLVQRVRTERLWTQERSMNFPHIVNAVSACCAELYLLTSCKRGRGVPAGAGTGRQVA